MTLCDGGEIIGPGSAATGRCRPTMGNADAVIGRQGNAGRLSRAHRERATIAKALTQTNQNKTAAAKLLGITFRALRYKLEKLGIE